MVRDEVRRVLRDDDTLAEPEVGKPRDPLDDRRIGIRRGDHLEQAQVPRRIEKMRTEPVLAEGLASAFGKRRDGNA